ncbi:unnamed protein product, partial [Choristocarpus tenellus]
PAPREESNQDTLCFQDQALSRRVSGTLQGKTCGPWVHPKCRSGLQFETFSPVVGYDTLRCIISVAAYRGWSIDALDFTQAYLYADLQEDIWLELPDGGTPLYFKKSEDGRIAILTTYVDDTFTTGDFSEEIQRIRASLLEKYKGRDLGTPDKLIGVGITVGKDGITLDQQICTLKPLSWPGWMGSIEVRKTSTPLDLSVKQGHEEELDPIIYPYASILGKLMFLAGMTQPDLANNSVRELGRRAASPCMRHWRGLQHVLRYVAGTLDVCIHYDRGDKDMNEGDEELLVGYGDSDWGTDSQTRRSVTGYLLLFNKSPITWRSKLQSAVTLSSSEAEWTAMAYGMRHYIFLQGILGEIGILQDQNPWFGDNRGAIQASRITSFNGRTTHVDMKLKCTREYVDQGLFHVEYVPTSKHLADILTKSL